MSQKHPTIDQYLISNFLFLIDEFNERFDYVNSKEELKLIANSGFSEADLTVRLGYLFKQMARFNIQGPDTRNVKVRLQKNF